MKTKYRLPSGKDTESVKCYVRDWRKMYKKMGKALNLSIISYDPGFSMKDKETNTGCVEIPMWFAERICELIDKVPFVDFDGKPEQYLKKQYYFDGKPE